MPLLNANNTEYIIYDFSKYIQELKKNCETWGMDKDKNPSLKVVLSEDQLKEKQQKYTDVLELFQYFTETTTMFQLSIPVFIVLNDKDGFLLDIYGEPIMKKAMEALGIKIGTQFVEKECGVNSITIALNNRCAVQCIGEDHYHTFFHQSACYSAPIFSPENDGEILGCLTIMTSIDHANPLFLTLLSTICDSLTRELKVKQQNKVLDILNAILFANSKNGVIICNAKGTITEMNQAAERLTGLKKEKLTSQPIQILGEVASYIEKVLVNGAPFNDIQYEFMNGQDNPKRVCLFDVFPVHNDKHETILAVFQCRDITNYRQMEERVFRLDKLSLIGQLSAGVAHEIRNPLASVKGFIQILFEDPERYTKYKELVLSEIERIEKLVSDFLLVTRPTHPNKQTVNLHEIMTGTLRFLNSESSLRNIYLKYQNDDPEQCIDADPDQLKQVILNVIKNAMDAIGNHGTIQVFVKEETNSMTITIQDDGPGIPEHILQDVQNPFFSTKENGIGLGLSICNQIVESHGGTIEIASTPYVGTTVTITLPSLIL